MLIPLNKGHIQISSQSKGETKRASRIVEWSEIWMENWTALLVKFFHEPAVWHGIKWPHLQSERWGSDSHKAISGPVIPFFLHTHWLRSDSQHRISAVMHSTKEKSPSPRTVGAGLGCEQEDPCSVWDLQKSCFPKVPKWPVTAQCRVSSQQMLKDHPWKGVSPKHLIITSTDD